jgi:hypothetical protein
VWEAGSNEEIITIPSKDSSSNGGDSHTSSSKLEGGTIAGIVVGCAIVAIIAIIGFTLVILRKRRKWMKAGFVATETKLEPDENMLNGPVFNSTPRSAMTNIGCPSTAEISDPRSTMDYSVSATDSPLPPAGFHRKFDGSSTPELDARDTQIRPSTELDGKELRTHRMGAEPERLFGQNPGIYELPGGDVKLETPVVRL